MSYSQVNFADKKQMVVPSAQATSIPPDYRHEVQRIPSVSAPAFGGYFTFVIRQKNVHLDDITIEFNMSALTGLTVTGGGTAGLVPSYFFPTRIDLVLGSTVIDSLYSLQNFLQTQFFARSDESRSYLNSGAGLYTSHTSRATKSASTSNWYLPLRALFAKTSSFPILNSTPDLEIRVYMDQLANLYTLTSGQTATGTPSCTINSAVALCRYSVMPSPTIAAQEALQRRGPVSFPFNEVRQQTFTVQAGVSSTSLVLSAITGAVHTFFFAIRPTSPTGANNWAFMNITSYNLLDAGSEPILGGQNVLSDQSTYVLAPAWIDTTFLNDQATVPYLYSFSLSPKEVVDKGVHLTARMFQGSEQLQIFFSSALASPVQVDFYALTHAAVEAQGSMIKKIALRV